MAISVTNKYNESSASIGSPFVTASSIAFANNRLYLVAVFTDADETTFSGITGGGITWVRIDGATGAHAGPSNFMGGALFRGLVTSGASTAALSVSYDVGSAMYIIVDEVTGMDTSGTNGSGAIVQAAADGDQAGADTSSSVTLASFGSGNNAGYSWMGKNEQNATTPDPTSTWTELADIVNGTNNNARLQTQWRTGEDTTVTTSWSTGGAWLAGAVEIKSDIPESPLPTIIRHGPNRRAGGF